MGARNLKIIGSIAAVTGVGLVIYFRSIGLQRSGDIANIIGLFIALAGLALAIYGVTVERRQPPEGGQAANDRAGRRGVQGMRGIGGYRTISGGVNVEGDHNVIQDGDTNVNFGRAADVHYYSSDGERQQNGGRHGRGVGRQNRGNPGQGGQ